MKLPKVFKKVVTAVCALALAIGVAGCGGGGEKEQFINIATGGTAGTYYPIGGAIAEVLNKNGMNCHNCGGSCHSQEDGPASTAADAELVASITRQVMAQLGLK